MIDHCLGRGVTIEYRGIPLRYYGGSFAGRSDFRIRDYLGVSLLLGKDHLQEGDIHIPTADFTAPPMNLIRKAVKKTMVEAVRGRKIYVGCGAGIGRTGTFLACVAKAAGYRHPIKWLRSQYHPQAVETKDQRELIQFFDYSPYWSTMIARLERKLRV